MLTDLLLASLHHLLIFAIIAMLVTESVLLRGILDRGVVQRLAGVDLGYGISAMALIVVGVLRVLYGIKGYDFYLHNPWFHAKIGAFLLVGLISIVPTLHFLRWRKALRQNPAFVPTADEAARMARLVRFELVLIAAILVFAAMMARYGGF
jgi:putative membrane protein